MGNFSEKQISIDAQSSDEFSNSDYENSIGSWWRGVKTKLSKKILPSEKNAPPAPTPPKGVPSTVPQYPVQTEKAIKASFVAESGFPKWGYFAIGGGVLLIGGIITFIVVRKK